MSSTNRGGDRHASDYYVTPIPPILDFLHAFHRMDVQSRRIADGYVLDPCAGGDPAHLMSYPQALTSFGMARDRITTVDIRPDSRAEIKANYLQWEVDKPYGLIISNPPFALAEDFIHKALRDVEEGGFVVMLLRLNFFEGKRRYESLWSRHMPKWAFVHSRRMSFTGGKTNSVAYMHCVWQKGINPATTALRVIE